MSYGSIQAKRDKAYAKSSKPVPLRRFADGSATATLKINKVIRNRPTGDHYERAVKKAAVEATGHKVRRHAAGAQGAKNWASDWDEAKGRYRKPAEAKKLMGEHIKKMNKLTGRTKNAAVSAPRLKSSKVPAGGAGVARQPVAHTLQKGKKGGTFYLSAGGKKVYAKK